MGRSPVCWGQLFLCLSLLETPLAVPRAGGAEEAAQSRATTVRIRVGKEYVELPDTSDETRGLDLSGLSLQSLYQADFSQPLRFVRERELLATGQRVRPAADIDWVLEGQADADTAEGRLQLANKGGHLVFWNTREFPANFLLEFTVQPANPNKGLNIVFFAARNTRGGDIFEPGLPLRDGVFSNYHSGELNCYHTSYWALSPEGEERGTAHIRKNRGFHLVSAGRDFLAGKPGMHRVRILNRGGQITVEVDGKIEVAWHDDGQVYGPILDSGRIGLRQMSHTESCQYGSFQVWAVAP